MYVCTYPSNKRNLTAPTSIPQWSPHSTSILVFLLYCIYLMTLYPSMSPTIGSSNSQSSQSPATDTTHHDQ
ncbi:hypothetical protein BDV27DRAFT_128102 [Aspergillus caelatus]|uniref:Uncharacterized protein n=1 Tax=Aspergillus caelatus TaxID=61420 RepID=A0A5N7A663_9EURO|nr:uncharacterized protein BDV27DRAFT_128102 [Aspergillus caelatus]KAE8364676.1 hypothetical protein BDV27DRAFT_128102 [Aspergillus caelatus]